MDTKHTIGNDGQNLVLATAGRIWVKVKDRFYELDFRHSNRTSKSIENDEQESSDVENNIDLSDYITKNQLMQILASYADTTEITNILNRLDELENSDNEESDIINYDFNQLVPELANLDRRQTQFDFIESLSSKNIIEPEIDVYDTIVSISETTIIHYVWNGPNAIQPNISINEYSRWTIEDSVATLDELDKPYYLYISAERLNNSKTGTAELYASTLKFEFDEDEDRLYFLCGIISPLVSGTRWFYPLYGFKPTLPGEISAYIYKSENGKHFLDFLNENFHIGDSTYMNYDSTNGMQVKGWLDATSGPVKEKLDLLVEQVENVESNFSTEIPTLTNAPANSWTTDLLKSQHVGDFYQAGDYSIYRFIKSGGTYSWKQIAKSIDLSAYLTKTDADNTYAKKSDLTSLQNAISELNDTVGSLQSKIGLLESKISTLEDLIASLEEKIESGNTGETTPTQSILWSFTNWTISGGSSVVLNTTNTYNDTWECSSGYSASDTGEIYCTLLADSVIKFEVSQLVGDMTCTLINNTSTNSYNHELENQYYEIPVKAGELRFKMTSGNDGSREVRVILFS